MGMAASQARLLTITSRLNHVELEAQNVSNAKIRLSDKTQAASDEYIAALNKTEYLYNYYDGSGEKISMSLTGSALTTYGELKNQYGLINSAGQILVSETDAKNYETSNTLEEFLEKYGVLGDLGTGDKIEVANPEYDIAMDDYNKEYDEWLTKKPDPNDEIYIIPGQATGSSMYEKFLDTTGICFEYAAKSKLSCYMHVLVDLIGSGEHETSSGEKFTVYSDCGSWDWNKTSHTRTQEMDELTEEIHNVYCSGDVIPGGSETVETSYGTVTVGGPVSDTNMIVYQRAVDLLWEVHNEYDSENNPSTGGPATEESLQKFFYFIEHDLAQFKEPEDEFDKEAYNDDLAAWEVAEPEKPDVPQFIEKEVRKITDLDKAQWYVNLWHRMNGTSDYRAGVGGDENFIAGDGWASKSTTEQSYAVLKDGEMNSSEYLKFAIENGIITLEQVQFVNPSKSEEGIENIEWTSIVFGSAQDITEQKDQAAITKAEVKYEQAQREIQAKDKEYETQLKKLDTEHNALQTEYDSIKSVIEKNVERGFKAFS